eukprot:3342134-Rhodomonas_salina.2
MFFAASSNEKLTEKWGFAVRFSGSTSRCGAGVPLFTLTSLLLMEAATYGGSDAIYGGVAAIYGGSSLAALPFMEAHADVTCGDTDATYDGGNHVTKETLM